MQTVTPESSTEFGVGKILVSLVMMSDIAKAKLTEKITSSF